MSVNQRQLNDDTWLVHASGRLDQSLNSELEKTLNELLAEGHYQLLVDLSQATYINSGGLRCLVSAWREARQHGGDVLLCGLNARLKEIFSLVGFDKVFRILPDCKDSRAFAEM